MLAVTLFTEALLANYNANEPQDAYPTPYNDDYMNKFEILVVSSSINDYNIA